MGSDVHMVLTSEVLSGVSGKRTCFCHLQSSRYSPECSIYVGGLEGEDEIWPEQHLGESSCHAVSAMLGELCRGCPVACKAVRALQRVWGGMGETSNNSARSADAIIS